MTIPIHVTDILVRSGVSNFQWSSEEAKRRGWEVHRAIELLDKGTLDRRSVPRKWLGYLRAYEKFKRECNYVPLHVEQDVSDRVNNIVGRSDGFGTLNGKLCVKEQKTNAARKIYPATRLQMCAYGIMRNPKKWWLRIAVALGPDARYSVSVFDEKTWLTDVSTWRACVVMTSPRQIPPDVRAAAKLRVEQWRAQFQRAA